MMIISTNASFPINEKAMTYILTCLSLDAEIALIFYSIDNLEMNTLADVFFLLNYLFKRNSLKNVNFYIALYTYCQMVFRGWKQFVSWSITWKRSSCHCRDPLLTGI